MKFGISKLRAVVILFAIILFGCDEKPKITTSSSDALRAYNDGVRSLDLFYYGDAIASFERALKVDSNFALASARLALALSRSGNEAAANKEIARALAESATTSTQEQLFIRIIDHALHYRNEAAALATDSLITISPKNAEAYVFRGGFYEVNKNFDAGLEMYKKAIAADTGYAPAVMSLGYAYSAQGDFDKAIEHMDRYIRLAPKAADPRASFADILFRAGRYDEALEQYHESLKLKPDYWYAINRIGDVYTVLGRLNDADKQFDLGLTKMVMNDQTRATHLATEAVLQFQRGKYEETIRLCEQSLALDSINWKAAYVRALALAKSKKFDDAEQTIHTIRDELLRRNLAESSAMLGFHLLSAMYLKERGLFDEALAECDSAFEYGPELSRTEVYREQADIRLKQSDYDGALDALEGALRYNSNAPEALLLLARAYAANGDKQMANEIGNRLLDIWKNADKDFQPLIELKRILGRSVQRSASVS